MNIQYLLMFFFFQAEDGIRDIGVTGVQTCALPIFGYRVEGEGKAVAISGDTIACAGLMELAAGADVLVQCCHMPQASVQTASQRVLRSEERRVGKECRSRWSPYH